MSKYIIQAIINKPGSGLVVGFLSKDLHFYQATNSTLKFETLFEARKFWLLNNLQLTGSSIWILGPRGGRHSVVIPDRNVTLSIVREANL